MRASTTQMMTGVAAGLAAALVMNLFQDSASIVLKIGKEKETAAARAADAVSSKITGKPIKMARKDKADSVVHYLVGSLAGAVFAVTRRWLPGPSLLKGFEYGLALWLIADQTLVPALGLMRKPKRTKAKKRLFGLASHLVFGGILDLVESRLERFSRYAP